MASSSETRDKVAFDTNMLLSCGELKLDVFEKTREALRDPRMIIPRPVLLELERLGEKSRKQAQNAALALQLAKKNHVRVHPGAHKKADTELLALARDHYTIATNDRTLRKRIKGIGGTCLIVRQKNRLVLQ